MFCSRWTCVWLEYRYNNISGTTDLGLSHIYTRVSVNITKNTAHGTPSSFSIKITV